MSCLFLKLCKSGHLGLAILPLQCFIHIPHCMNSFHNKIYIRLCIKYVYMMCMV
jgi:hypothetical protein